MDTQATSESVNTSQDNVNPEAESNKEVSDKVQEKTFTQSELDNIIEKRLKKERAKFDKEKANLSNEAQRLASLSADERNRELLESERSELAQLKQELLEEKAELQRQQLVSATMSELGKLNLPTSFAELLVGEDAETTKANINNFNKEFSKAVTAEVNNRLKNSPKPASNTTSIEASKAREFKNMSLAERQALYNSDPDLYRKLSKRK